MFNTILSLDYGGHTVLDLLRHGFNRLILSVESKIMIFDSLIYHHNLVYPCNKSI
jgi:hypothetical protein